VIAEFYITRGAYNIISTMTLKKRSNKQLRKLFKEYITLNNNKIKQELWEGDSTKYRSIKGN
jgi:hypothetical protein